MKILLMLLILGNVCVDRCVEHGGDDCVNQCEQAGLWPMNG